MADITIATPFDIKQCYKVLRECFPDESFLTKTEMSLLPLYVWFGKVHTYKVKKEVVGLVIASAFGNRLGFLCVKHKHRGKGYGIALKNYAEQLIIKRGVEYITAYCHRDKLEFYESIGYKVEGVIKIKKRVEDVRV